jgi:hypothetical protein
MPNGKNKTKQIPYPRRKKKQVIRQQTQQVRYVQAPQVKVPRSTLGKVLDSGNAIAKIFGWGAYSVKSNTLWDGTLARQVPHMQSNMENITFRHREYIGDISSSVAFESKVFQVNPGLDDTFPYLAAIARNFQQYKFKGLIFEFKSTSASALNSTNTALGTVALAMQYQSDCPDFSNKNQLLNEMWSVDGKPSENVLLPIECDPTMTTIPLLYTRSGAQPTSSDLKMYDLGKVTIATVGSQAAAVIGELWVSYEVELQKPQLYAGLAIGSETAHYSLVPTSATPLSTPAKYLDYIGLTISDTTIVFPTSAQGKYLVAYNCVTSGAAVTLAIPSVSPTNCTIDYDFVSHTTNFVLAPEDGATTKSFTIFFVITITTPQSPSVLTFGAAGTLPVAATCHGDLVVTQLPYDFS